MDQLQYKIIDLSQTYGSHETQASESVEADLQKYLIDCDKNPGHKEFIPVNTFHTDHLPEKYRDNDIYEFIKATADLTVRIDVKMTSPHRPEFWPGSNVPYPFYNMRDKSIVRYGSGQISVYTFDEGRGCNVKGSGHDILGNTYDRPYTRCPCGKCHQSLEGSSHWWEVRVTTATHVVFDEIEASHTTCKLLYDEKDSHVIPMDKVCVHTVQVEKDWCQLNFVTCDTELGDRLHSMMKHWHQAWGKLWDKFKGKPDVKFTFIVSHPHGCPKQISIGEWMDNQRMGEVNNDFFDTKLTYTTCTCPGSSGAMVNHTGFGNHVHCGALVPGVNLSGVGLFRK